MITPEVNRRRMAAGSKAHRVRALMDQKRAENVPRQTELFERCAMCGNPLVHWYWRAIPDAAPLKLEKICKDCAGEA